MDSRKINSCRVISALFISVFIFSLILAYLYFLDLKNILVARISDKASSFIGQRIEVGDLSFGSVADISIHKIVISNPAGSAKGELLKINKISFVPVYSELLNGRFFFRSVEVDSPEVFLNTDSNNKLNVSDELKELLIRKGTLDYRIDSLSVKSGKFDFNNDPRYRQRDIELVFENLSSEKGIKTAFRAGSYYLGNNKIEAEGWAYLKDEPKRFSISLSSENIELSILKDTIKRLKLDHGIAGLAFEFRAEGDLAKGILLSSKIRIKDSGLKLFSKNINNVFLTADAFLNPDDFSLAINDITLNTGKESSVQAKGMISNILRNPSYNAEVKIGRFELSGLKFTDGITSGGILISDAITVKGSLNKPIAEVSGSLRIIDAFIRSDKADVRKMQAYLVFSSDKKISGRAELSAELLRVGDYLLKKPAGIGLSVNIVGRPERFEIVSTANASGVNLDLSDGRSFHADSIAVTSDGIYKEIQFSGSNSFSAETISFSDYQVKHLSGNFGAELGLDKIILKNMKVKADNIISSADLIKARLSEKDGSLFVGIRNLNGSYDRQKALLRQLNCDMNLNVRDKRQTGNISFSLGEISWREVSAGSVSGSGTFDNDLMSGTASFSAENISIAAEDTRKKIIKDGVINANLTFKWAELLFKAEAKAGTVSASITGSVGDLMSDKRSLLVQASVPETNLQDIRNSFWEIFPDRLLYAGLDGAVSTDISVEYKGTIRAEGRLRLINVVLEGENGEYSAGPVNGIIPIYYKKYSNGSEASALPIFESSEYETLKKFYAGLRQPDKGYRITIGSLRYGFKVLEDIDIWLHQDGQVLNVNRISANMFGGRVNGSVLVDFSEGFRYRGGIIAEGISLAKLCDEIHPIRGYLAGKVDGVVFFRATDSAVGSLSGKADFWTYSSKDEKTRISREFLEKIGGPAVKAYLGERRFDKGIMGLYIQNGFLIFRELEISNRNFFGMTDLSVKVAPLNNRIAIDHLLWTITQAAERAKKE